MDITQNETILNLFAELNIDTSHTTHSLEKLAAVDSRFIRDLKLNVSSVLGSAHIDKKESYLLALSVAINSKNEMLTKAFEDLAIKEGATQDVIADTHACTAVMNVNNVFYRFKHYMDGVEYYEKQPAGLRMNVMMNPSMGKELFELMSLVVSALNGCERCVASHENSVKQHGASEPRIFDAIRLASVIKSLCLVL